MILSRIWLPDVISRMWRFLYDEANQKESSNLTHALKALRNKVLQEYPRTIFYSSQTKCTDPAGKKNKETKQ